MKSNEEIIKEWYIKDPYLSVNHFDSFKKQIEYKMMLALVAAAREDERERVEGEFAEWCDIHNFRRDLVGLWYNAIGGSDDYRKRKTSELYQLFIKSKNNTP